MVKNASNTLLFKYKSYINDRDEIERVREENYRAYLKRKYLRIKFKFIYTFFKAWRVYKRQCKANRKLILHKWFGLVKKEKKSTSKQNVYGRIHYEKHKDDVNFREQKRVIYRRWYYKRTMPWLVNIVHQWREATMNSLNTKVMVSFF